MKSQDIVLLLKLISLEKSENRAQQVHSEELAMHDVSDEDGSWRGWVDEDASNSLKLQSGQHSDRYSMRSLEAVTGISKSEISASLGRSLAVGLFAYDYKSNLPRANHRALQEFIVHGLKYVFPVKPGALVRGIPTSFSAPVMQGKLMSAGDVINVWPDSAGTAKGQSITPLFKSVPKAVKIDPTLYKLLALVDAIRMGNSRESQLAIKLLEQELAA
jgi:hypothetical protein